MITGKQRSELKKLAQDLKPTVMIGKEDITPNIISAIDDYERSVFSCLSSDFRKTERLLVESERHIKVAHVEILMDHPEFHSQSPLFYIKIFLLSGSAARLYRTNLLPIA